MRPTAPIWLVLVWWALVRHGASPAGECLRLGKIRLFGRSVTLHLPYACSSSRASKQPPAGPGVVGRHSQSCGPCSMSVLLWLVCSTSGEPASGRTQPHRAGVVGRRVPASAGRRPRSGRAAPAPPPRPECGRRWGTSRPPAARRPAPAARLPLGDLSVAGVVNELALPSAHGGAIGVGGQVHPDRPTVGDTRLSRSPPAPTPRPSTPARITAGTSPTSPRRSRCMARSAPR
jgi:hypothetical protein